MARRVRGETGNRFLPLFLVLAQIAMVIGSINASVSPIITLAPRDTSQTAPASGALPMTAARQQISVRDAEAGGYGAPADC